MLRFVVSARVLVASAAILGVTVAAALGLIWSPAGDDVTPAEAHGVVDQSQTQGASLEFNGQKPMQQSFKPTASSLVAVDVKGSSAGSDQPDLLWTVQIRSSFQYGPVIAMQSHIGAFYDATVYHIDFPSPVTVTPGDTYWIEVSATGNYFLWATQFTGNPYANGAADSEVTDFYPDADRYFVTYGGPAPTPSPSPTPPITPRPTRTPTRH